MSKEKRLIKKLVKVLLDCDCQFWACEGWHKRPVNMKTCGRCRALYNVFRTNPELKELTNLN